LEVTATPCPVAPDALTTEVAQSTATQYVVPGTQETGSPSPFPSTKSPGGATAVHPGKLLTGVVVVVVLVVVVVAGVVVVVTTPPELAGCTASNSTAQALLWEFVKSQPAVAPDSAALVPPPAKVVMSQYSPPWLFCEPIWLSPDGPRSVVPKLTTPEPPPVPLKIEPKAKA